MLAKFLNIRHKIPSSILYEARMRCALSRTALIEQHDAISRWIVKLPILRYQPTTWPAVKKHHRLPAWIATLLVVKVVNMRDFQTAGIVRFDWIIEGSEVMHNLTTLHKYFGITQCL